MADQRYYAYYVAQAKGVGGNAKLQRVQKGLGVGSTLVSLLRRLFPYVKSGLKAVGSELLSSGVNILKDSFDSKKDFKDSLKTHITNAGANLGAKGAEKVNSLLGMGAIKRKRRGSTSQSVTKRKRVRRANKSRSQKNNKRKIKKPRKRDIFS